MAFDFNKALIGAGTGLVSSGMNPWGALIGGVAGGIAGDLGSAGQTSYRSQLDPNILAQQQGFINALQAQAAGQGPNVAGAQLNRALQQAQGQAAGMAAGVKGISPATAARLAMQQQSNLAAQAAGQSGELQARQQLAAQQLQGAALSGLQQQQLATQGTNAQMALYNQAMQNQMFGNILETGGKVGAAWLANKPKNTQTNTTDATNPIENAPDQTANPTAPSTGIGQTMMPSPFAQGGEVKSYMAQLKEKYSQGGDIEGKVPGKAKVAGDSPKNDTVPAMLSAGEIVIPRSIAQHENAPEMAAQFVANILKKKGYAEGGEVTEEPIQSMDMASTTPNLEPLPFYGQAPTKKGLEELPFYGQIPTKAGLKPLSTTPAVPEYLSPKSKLAPETITSLKEKLAPKESGEKGYTALNKDTGAYGKYQAMPETWKKLMPGIDLYKSTPAQQETFIEKLAESNAKNWRQFTKQEPSVSDLSVMHQQGATATKKMLQNPNANAANVLGKDAVLKNGGNTDMTVKEFEDHIRNYYGNNTKNQEIPFWQRPEIKPGVENLVPDYSKPQDLSWTEMAPKTRDRGLFEAPRPGETIPSFIPGMSDEQFSQEVMHPFIKEQAYQKGVAPYGGALGPMSPEEQQVNDEYNQMVKSMDQAQNPAMAVQQQTAAPDYWTPVNERMQSGLAGQVLGTAQIAAGKMQEAQQAADIQNQFINDMAPINQEYQNTVKQYQQQRDELLNGLMTTRIDPTNFYANKSTSDKIGLAVSMMLGGIAAGFKGGPNMVSEQIDKMIDRDIDAQKANINKQESLLRLNFMKSQDINAAYNMTKLQMLTDVEHRLLKAQAEAKIPQVKGELSQAIGNINMQMVPLAKQAAVTETMNKVYGAWGAKGGVPSNQMGTIRYMADVLNDPRAQQFVKNGIEVTTINPTTKQETSRTYEAKSPEVFNKMIEVEPLYKDFQRKMNDLLDLIKSGAFTRINPESRSLANQNRTQLANIISQLNAKTFGSNRLPPEAKHLNDLVSDETSFFTLLNNAVNTKKTMLDMMKTIENQRSANLHGYKSFLGPQQR